MFYRLWNRRKRAVEPELDLPLVGSRDRQFRGLFAGVPLIVGLVIVSVLGAFIFFHIRFMGKVGECRADLLASVNLRVIAEEAPYFLQPMGSLSSELYSPDSPEQVDQALRRAVARVQRQAVISGDFRDLPQQTWTVEAAQAGGSHVVLYCP